MQGWHALELGDLLTAQVMLDRLRDAVEARATETPRAAVFTRRTSGELHCAVTAYFPPAAQDLARSFGAEPCPPPGRRGLELLVGPTASWDELL